MEILIGTKCTQNVMRRWEKCHPLLPAKNLNPMSSIEELVNQSGTKSGVRMPSEEKLRDDLENALLDRSGSLNNTECMINDILPIIYKYADDFYQRGRDSMQEEILIESGAFSLRELIESYKDPEIPYKKGRAEAIEEIASLCHDMPVRLTPMDVGIRIRKLKEKT
jgi:hypothetical protein